MSTSAAEPDRSGWFLLAAAVCLLVLPSLVFIGVALTYGLTWSDTTSALYEQYRAERTNLAMITLLGLAPLLLPALMFLIQRLWFKSWRGIRACLLGGVIPIILISILTQMSFWPDFLPERKFQGFPHGLEFVIGPLVFAPPASIAGMLLTGLLAPRFRQ